MRRIPFISLLALWAAWAHPAGAAPAASSAPAFQVTARVLAPVDAAPGGDAATPDITMPWLEAGAPGVASRINEALFRQMLGIPAPANPGRSFSTPDGQPPAGTDTLAFTIVRNDPALFVVTLRGQGCGAYCEGFEHTFDFRSRDGQRIALDDLLDARGLAALARRLQELRGSLYAAQVASLARQLAAPGLAGPARDDAQQRLALNASCLAAERSASPAGDDPLAADFALLQDGTLRLVAARCSNHADRALDDVGPVHLTLDASVLAPYLTADGRALLPWAPRAAPRPATAPASGRSGRPFTRNAPARAAPVS